MKKNYINIKDKDQAFRIIFDGPCIKVQDPCHKKKPVKFRILPISPICKLRGQFKVKLQIVNIFPQNSIKNHSVGGEQKNAKFITKIYIFLRAGRKLFAIKQNGGGVRNHHPPPGIWNDRPGAPGKYA